MVVVLLASTSIIANEIFTNGPRDWVYIAICIVLVLLLPIIYFSQFDLNQWRDIKRTKKHQLDEFNRIRLWNKSLLELNKTNPEIVDRWLFHKIEECKFFEYHADAGTEAFFEKEYDRLSCNNPLCELGNKAKAR